MAILRMQLTANDDDASALINQIQSLQGVESAEDVDYLMFHMDDPDSSSAGSSDDSGPGTHLIKVIAGNNNVIQRALELAEAAARDMGAALEVVSNEERWNLPH